MRPINEVIVHCTATRPEWWKSKSTNQKVAEVRRWHTSPPRNWRDIGYHYLIDRDGTVAEGRPVEQTGAHVKGKNTGTIGIALFGGHGSNENDQFSENFTPEQDDALSSLLGELYGRFPITRISGHNQYAAKACPGFKVSEWLAKRPVEAPKADWAPDPQEQAPSGLAGLIQSLLAILKGWKQ